MHSLRNHLKREETNKTPLINLLIKENLVKN